MNLSSNLGDSINRQIAVAGSNVYVVWADNTPGNYEIFFRKSTNGGITFGSTINVSNNAGFSFFPQIAVAGSTVYVVWTDNTPGNNDIFFRKSNSWEGPINVSNNSGSSSNSQIAVF
jgi:hypothetical protein